MELLVDVPIFCTDGQFGQAVGLILHPATRRVTHVIAMERGFAKTEYLLPLALISSATTEVLRLASTHQEVTAMTPFVESEYQLGGAGYSAAGEEGAYWPTSEEVDGSYEDIPVGELEIHRYARVDARDGHAGRVDGFAVEPASGRITHLIMREGHLWRRKEVAVPVAAITQIEDESIRLDLDKATVADLPDISPHHHGKPKAPGQ